MTPSDDGADLRSMTREQQLAAIEEAGRRYYYTAEQEFDDRNKRMVIEEMLPFLRPGPALELGYTNDIWTRALLERASHVTIIEAATNHIERARKDFAGDPRVTVVQTLFEEFEPVDPFSTVLMSGVIKHLPDDMGFLKRARSWVAQDGVAIATTPNSRSFHRRLGAMMGIQTAPDQHNTRDREVFNVHLYDRYSWQALYREAGYNVKLCRGVFFKPFSTQQMIHLGQKYDIDAIMDGLRRMGEELQDYAWYLLLVAQP